MIRIHREQETPGHAWIGVTDRDIDFHGLSDHIALHVMEIQTHVAHVHGRNLEIRKSEQRLPLRRGGTHDHPQDYPTHPSFHVLLTFIAGGPPKRMFDPGFALPARTTAGSIPYCELRRSFRRRGDRRPNP